MRTGTFVVALLLPMAAVPAETRVEGGVRVHRAAAQSATAVAARPDRTHAITLDPSYGARPSCASMDWRLSVPRDVWEARCGDDGHARWYDRWIYRGRY